MPFLAKVKGSPQFGAVSFGDLIPVAELNDGDLPNGVNGSQYGSLDCV